jgi:hypothetical protein
VTASNFRGTASQTSNPVDVPVPAGGAGSGGPGAGTTLVAPVLTGAGESHTIWVEGPAQPRISRTRRHPVGTVFRFMLNETATVRFTFLRATPGRKVGRKCVAQTKRNRAKPRCTRFVPAGTLKFTGHAGLNKVAFQGHITTRKKLPLGTYTLSITATNAAGQKSAPKTLRFKIVKR